MILITPSGIPYHETTEEDIVLMTLEGDVLEGNRKPSSEYDMHRIFTKEHQLLILLFIHIQTMLQFLLAYMKIYCRFTILLVQLEQELDVVRMKLSGLKISRSGL